MHGRSIDVYKFDTFLCVCATTPVVTVHVIDASSVEVIKKLAKERSQKKGKRVREENWKRAACDALCVYVRQSATPQSNKKKKKHQWCRDTLQKHNDLNGAPALAQYPCVR